MCVSNVAWIPTPSAVLLARRDCPFEYSVQCIRIYVKFNPQRDRHRRLFSHWLSHHLHLLQRYCSYGACLNIPSPGHIQGPFRIAALPSVLEGRRQIVGRLPSEGDTALQPSHFGSAQFCLFSLNTRRTPLTRSSLRPVLTTVFAKSWSQTD